MNLSQNNDIVWISETQKQWQTLTTWFFEQLKPNEAASIGLVAENSTYVRLNNRLVRQNTNVEQLAWELTLVSEKRKTSFSLMGPSNENTFKQQMLNLLQRARADFSILPVDPFCLTLTHSGVSEENYALSTKAEFDLKNFLSDVHSVNLDIAGILTCGPVIRANRNSLGQDHWFATSHYFFDYSIYTVNSEGANKAVKGTLSGTAWNQEDWKNEIRKQAQFLDVLKGSATQIKRGAYRTYIEPAALNYLGSMFSWNGISYSAYKRGAAAMGLMQDEGRQLSSHFTLKENFNLGLTTRFNSLGEMAPGELSLIEKGQLKNWMVTTRAGLEFSIPSNATETTSWGAEPLRSMDILPGHLREEDILKELDQGLYLSQLHYLNWSDLKSARITGMTRYAAFWVDKGQITAPIQDMRFDISLYDVLGDNLIGLTDRSYVFPNIESYGFRPVGGSRAPGALMKDFNFTL